MVRTGAFVVALLVTFLITGGRAVADHAAGHVTATNANDVAFFVTWITSSDVTGQVEYSTTAGDLPGSGTTVNDERGGATSDDSHTVAIGGLTADTTYFYDVISGGVRDNNGGAHYQVTTGGSLSPPGNEAAIGLVKRQDNTNAVGCLVYFTIGTGGQVMSSYVQDFGGATSSIMLLSGASGRRTLSPTKVKSTAPPS